jgi:hypothetical protein
MVVKMMGWSLVGFPCNMATGRSLQLKHGSELGAQVEALSSTSSSRRRQALLPNSKQMQLLSPQASSNILSSSSKSMGHTTISNSSQVLVLVLVLLPLVAVAAPIATTTKVNISSSSSLRRPQKRLRVMHQQQQQVALVPQQGLHLIRIRIRTLIRRCLLTGLPVTTPTTLPRLWIQPHGQQCSNKCKQQLQRRPQQLGQEYLAAVALVMGQACRQLPLQHRQLLLPVNLAGQTRSTLT